MRLARTPPERKLSRPSENPDLRQVAAQGWRLNLISCCSHP